MKTIIYEAIGTKVSDFDINKFVDYVFSDQGLDTYSICNALVLDEIRARVKEGKINHEDLTAILRVDGEESEFAIDKDGRSLDWKPCLDVHCNIMMRLI